MPFLPTSRSDRDELLSAIGIMGAEQLFAAIPEQARFRGSLKVDGPAGELELRRFFRTTPSQVVFTGGGIYRHYIPAIVDSLASRQEFLTAYTPYQPEISQGTLQATFEFQSMMAALTGMDASNASMYDGATAFAEAAFMATRAGAIRRIIVTRSTNPAYRSVLRTYFRNSPDMEIVEAPFDPGTGRVDMQALEGLLGSDSALFIQQPNYFGVIEDLDEVSRAATRTCFWGVVVTEAASLGLLDPPGSFGCDVVAGEAQSFGNPANAGGPLLGFFCVKREHIRRIPGRIVGLSRDRAGRRAFCLTLSTREQHIRREKATSNICTNEGLCALRAAIYLSALGPGGLRSVALQCAAGMRSLMAALRGKGIRPVFSAPVFHECVVRMDGAVLGRMKNNGIAAGIPIHDHYPELDDGLLMNVTEMNTNEDILCLTGLL
ncbi:MAG TPA: aminomethyl-transferring glycine dehydrogenase subunit GcvPA [Desulfomonilia bacterium]|nr:aminomethyl-transferring glycine dehydrogenase subunit GcvPA [Desulfomonilia bacterium]